MKNQLFIFVTAIIQLSTCYANDLNEGQQLLNFWLASRAAFVSGICKLEGTLIETIRDTNQQVTRNLQCDIAFDSQRHLYRFDRHDAGKYFRDAAFQYQSLAKPGKERGHVSATRTRLDESSYEQIWPFDVNSFGFFMLTGPAYFTEFEKIHQSFRKVQILEVEKNPNGIVKVKFLPKGWQMNMATTVWIDTQKGYTSPKIEYGRLCSSEISYVEKSGVWIPSSFSMKYGYSIPNNATTLAADFTLDWESVNCAEKSQMLDITDFAPENGSGEIITWELDSDEPIRISTFRKGSGLLETNPQKPSYSRYILITLGLLMIIISLVKMYYDRKKRKSA